MVLITISRESSILEYRDKESSENLDEEQTVNGEVESLENDQVDSLEDGFELERISQGELGENIDGDIELTENEQDGRMHILLSGIASILLVNIIAVVIVFAFQSSDFGEIKQRNFSQKEEQGKIFLGNKYIK